MVRGEGEVGGEVVVGGLEGEWEGEGGFGWLERVGIVGRGD